MSLRQVLLPGMTILGVVALVVVPLLRPDRQGTPRDPVGQAVLDLLQVTPGLDRTATDKIATTLYVRPDGIEVFRHPRSEFLRIDVRFQDHRVIAVSDPYLAHFPNPKRLP
jgi:hypothetical protein